MTPLARASRDHLLEVGRRDVLRLGGLGLSWLASAVPAWARSSRSREAADRSVILLLLVGGPSQLETWDPKPDAPSEVRGPFGSIATAVPGVRVSEHLPRLAARMDRLAIIRSLYHDDAPIHETGCQLLQTGRLCRAGEESPHFGCLTAHLLGSRNGMPAFALLPGPIKTTGIDIPHGQTSSWLGAQCDPTSPSAAPPGAALDEYGHTSFGQNCLLSRQLVEAGVRVVTVNMFDTVFNQPTWDCHGAEPFGTFDDYVRVLLPDFDRAFSALIDDLDRRGRLDSTLVIAAGEFGRTPRINSSGGRDHWPGVWSIAMAGGGIRGGQVLGGSDAHAAYPADRPVTPQDVLATTYHSLGIDSTRQVPGPRGEPFLLVEGGRPIHELFG